MFRNRLLLFVFPGFLIGILVLILISLPRYQYSVLVGDKRIVVNGEYETVRDILNAGDIDIVNQDNVFPGRDSDSINNMTILVQKARSVTVKLDKEEETVWTHQNTLGQFLQETGLLSGSRSAVVLADGHEIGFAEFRTAPMPTHLEIINAKEVTIRSRQRRYSIETKAQTVGEALLEAGLEIHPDDEIHPSLGAWLYSGAEILIKPANEYLISIDNEIINIRSHHTSSIEILSEAGIGLIGQDYVLPGPAVSLQSGDVIHVVRVTTDRIFEDITIPYQSTWQGVDQLELDQRTLVSEGRAGVIRNATIIRLENDVEVDRLPAGQWILQEPVNEVIGYGTNIVIRTLDTPEGPIEYWRKVRMWATSYTAASAGKPRDHPGYGITASGVPAGTGVIAVDPRIVPFRSQVYIEGYGIAFAGDTGGGVKGRIVDLGYDEGQLKSWNRYVDVYYLTPVPASDRITYIIPD